jgi:hypothetical protein
LVGQSRTLGHWKVVELKMGSILSNPSRSAHSALPGSRCVLETGAQVGRAASAAPIPAISTTAKRTLLMMTSRRVKVFLSLYFQWCVEAQPAIRRPLARVVHFRQT